MNISIYVCYYRSCLNATKQICQNCDENPVCPDHTWMVVDKKVCHFCILELTKMLELKKTMVE